MILSLARGLERLSCSLPEVAPTTRADFPLKLKRLLQQTWCGKFSAPYLPTALSFVHLALLLLMASTLTLRTWAWAICPPMPTSSAAYIRKISQRLITWRLLLSASTPTMLMARCWLVPFTLMLFSFNITTMAAVSIATFQVRQHSGTSTLMSGTTGPRPFPWTLTSDATLVSLVTLALVAVMNHLLLSVKSLTLLFLLAGPPSVVSWSGMPARSGLTLDSCLESTLTCLLEQQLPPRPLPALPPRRPPQQNRPLQLQPLSSQPPLPKHRPLRPNLPPLLQLLQAPPAPSREALAPPTERMLALVAASVSATTVPGLSSPVPLGKFASRQVAEFTAVLLALLTQSANCTVSNALSTYATVFLPFWMIIFMSWYFRWRDLSGNSQGWMTWWGNSLYIWKCPIFCVHLQLVVSCKYFIDEDFSSHNLPCLGCCFKYQPRSLI